MSYKFVSIAASVLYGSLFICLLVLPELIYLLFGLQGNKAADFLSRRASILMLGLAILSFLGRNAPPSNLRNSVTLALSFTVFGLILIGMYEYFTGSAGPGIWVAVFGEILLFIAYLQILRKDTRSLKV